MMTKQPIYAGVIGDPIAQSRSPIIHRYWLNQLNIEGDYKTHHVTKDDLAAFLEKAQTSMAGFNVTVPHKEAIRPLVDDLLPNAQAIGAVNTVWFEKGRSKGDNTDAYGFIAHLKQSAPTWDRRKPVAVLGSGGAARAILYALLQEQISSIILLNRTKARADQLAKAFGKNVSVAHWDERAEAIKGCGLLVNSTSLGLTGKPLLEIDITALHEGAIVYDIVYNPLETPLLKAAKKQGFQPVDGLGMLLHQAVPGFERWYGVRPAVTRGLIDHVLATL